MTDLMGQIEAGTVHLSLDARRLISATGEVIAEKVGDEVGVPLFFPGRDVGQDEREICENWVEVSIDEQRIRLCSDWRGIGTA